MIWVLWGEFDLIRRDHLVLITQPTHTAMAVLSELAYDLNSTTTSSSLLKKYEQWVAQLILKQTHSPELTDAERFELLKQFFFEDRKFKPLSIKPKLDRYLLPYLLLSRSGPQELLLLVFLCLAESIRVPLQVIKHSDRMIIKLIDNGRSRMFDFKKKCEWLSTQEVLDLVNQGTDCNQIYNFTDLLSNYLLLLKTQSLRERSFIQLYKIQSHLIQHQPFALNHFLDRARAAYAIGDVVRAAEDMSQYLVYHKDTVINGRLLRLAQKIKNEGLLKNLPYIGDRF